MFNALTFLLAHYTWTSLLWAFHTSFDAITYFFSSIAVFPGCVLQSLREATHNWYTFITSDLPRYFGLVWSAIIWVDATIDSHFDFITDKAEDFGLWCLDALTYLNNDSTCGDWAILIVNIVGAAVIVILFYIPAVLVYRREFEEAYALLTTGAADDKDSETDIEAASDNEDTVFIDVETEILPTENGLSSSDRLTSDDPRSDEGVLEVTEAESSCKTHVVADETHADSCRPQERAEVESEKDHVVLATITQPVELQDLISTEAQAPEPIVATPPKHDAVDNEPISFEATPALISLHEELTQEDKKPIASEDVLSSVASHVKDVLPVSIPSPTESSVLHSTPVAEFPPPSAATYIPTQQELAEQAIKTPHGMSDEL